MAAPNAPGSFEHIEEQIRALDLEKAKGDAFEKLCLHFLQKAPRYRGRFKHVWLWDDWPGRWGSDKGIAPTNIIPIGKFAIAVPQEGASESRSLFDDVVITTASGNPVLPGGIPGAGELPIPPTQ
jgi:hypothetical protein